MNGLPSDLAQRISAALNSDPRTRDAPIEVIDDDGLVTLRGAAGSEEVVKAALEIARQQEGVLDVINEMAVQPDEASMPPTYLPPGPR